jgi:hypothetical protein
MTLGTAAFFRGIRLKEQKSSELGAMLSMPVPLSLRDGAKLCGNSATIIDTGGSTSEAKSGFSPTINMHAAISLSTGYLPG